MIESVADSSDPMLAAWLRFREAVVGAAMPGGAGAASNARRAGGRSGSTARPVAAPGPTTVWRLLAPNNRWLARSAACFDGPDAARAALAVLRERTGELELVVGASGHRNGWMLALDGEPVLLCSRWYPARAANVDAAGAARSALAEARVEDRAHVLSATRRR